MKAQLALALLAVGPLKSGVAPAAAAIQPDKPSAETKDARDPIAFPRPGVAREALISTEGAKLRLP